MKSPVVKRSIVVAGHKTSVSLEEAFWNGMKEISGLRDMTLSELVGEIDGNRQQGNLSSAIRLFVLDHFRSQACGEPAVADPKLVGVCSERFGAQCIVVAIDAKAVGEGKWEVYTHGGRRPTRLDAVEWARRAVELGAGELLVTSMDADGGLVTTTVLLPDAVPSAVVAVTVKVPVVLGAV